VKGTSNVERARCIEFTLTGPEGEPVDLRRSLQEYTTFSILLTDGSRGVRFEWVAGIDYEGFPTRVQPCYLPNKLLGLEEAR
jgi:hypothetical protein